MAGVVKEDIFAYVKSRLTVPQAATSVAQATAVRLDCRHYLTFTALVAVSIKPMTPFTASFCTAVVL